MQKPITFDPPQGSYWFTVEALCDDDSWENVRLGRRDFFRIGDIWPWSVAMHDGPGTYRVKWWQRDRSRQFIEFTKPFDIDEPDEETEGADNGNGSPVGVTAPAVAVAAVAPEPAPTGAPLPQVAHVQPAPAAPVATRPQQPKKAKATPITIVQQPPPAPAPAFRATGAATDAMWTPVLLFDHLANVLEMRERARDAERRDAAERERLRVEQSAQKDREFFIAVVGLLQGSAQQQQTQQQTFFNTLLESQKAVSEARIEAERSRGDSDLDVDELADQIEELKERLTQPNAQPLEPSQLERLIAVGGSLVQTFLQSDFAKQRWPNAATFAGAAGAAAEAYQGMAPATGPAPELEQGEAAE